MNTFFKMFAAGAGEMGQHLSFLVLTNGLDSVPNVHITQYHNHPQRLRHKSSTCCIGIHTTKSLIYAKLKIHTKYLKDKLKCLQPLMNSFFNVFACAVELFCDMGPLLLESMHFTLLFLLVFHLYVILFIEMSPAMQLCLPVLDLLHTSDWFRIYDSVLVPFLHPPPSQLLGRQIYFT